MSRKPKQAATTMWEVAEEVPRAGIPSNDKLARRMRWYRRVITACLVAFPVIVLALFVTAASLKAATEAAPVAVVIDSNARAAAITAVTDWLSGDPSPLPGGELVTWNEGVTMPAYVPGSSDTEQDIADTPTLAVHSLTVRDGTGATFITQVLVASNRFGEVSVVGTPSLLPVAPSSERVSGVSPWPNHDGTTPAASVETAVEAWVEAFTSGDPAKLRLTVGDPDTNHTYVPMSGLVGAEHGVTGAAWLVDAQGEQTSSMIVQVETRFAWPTVVTDDEVPPDPAVATYDLLVEGANSAAPRVVAWGGLGTGPVLQAYSNALVGRELVAAPPVVPSPTGTADTTPPTTNEEG